MRMNSPDDSGGNSSRRILVGGDSRWNLSRPRIDAGSSTGTRQN
jgi:hypothetical protein